MNDQEKFECGDCGWKWYYQATTENLCPNCFKDIVQEVEE